MGGHSRSEGSNPILIPDGGQQTVGRGVPIPALTTLAVRCGVPSPALTTLAVRCGVPT